MQSDEREYYFFHLQTIMDEDYGNEHDDGFNEDEVLDEEDLEMGEEGVKIIGEDEADPDEQELQDDHGPHSPFIVISKELEMAKFSILAL